MITTDCLGCGILANCNDAELCDDCANDPEVVGEDYGGCPECGAGGAGSNPYAECECE